MAERASAKDLILMVDNIQRKLRQMVSELQLYKTPPRQVTDEAVYNYMFDLQESGEVNMLAATPYIKRAFGVSEDIASNYLINYIENYDELYAMYRAPIPLEVTIPLPQPIAPLEAAPVVPLAGPVAPLEAAPVVPLAGPVAPLEAAPVAPPEAPPVTQKKRGAKRYDEMTEEEQAAAKAKRLANKANKAAAAVPVVPVAPLPAPVPEAPKAKRVIKIKK